MTKTPASADAWGRYGQVLEAAEFLEQAEACYAHALSLDPGSARWAHLLGLLQLRDAPARGLENLARAAELAGTTNDSSRLRLAQAMVERGEFPGALHHLERLIQIRPNHAAAHLEWARIRLAEQKPAEAARWLTPCLTNPYTARPAAMLMSQIRAREGDTNGATQWARRATGMPRPFDWPDPFQREVQALRDDRARLAERVQGYLAQGRMADAKTELARLLEAAPEDPEGMLLSGRLMLLERNCAEAEKRFREHIRVAGETINGLTQWALALLCQQKWLEAIEVLDRVIRLKPDFAQAHANLAVAHSRLGDSTRSIASYRQALHCSPGDASSHAGLAEELLKSGSVSEGRTHLERALALDPSHARARALKESLARGE